MARDPDGKPIETRGRRSVSQRTRDLTEQLKGVGTLFDGSPRILEAVLTGVFFGSLVYFLRPKLIVTVSTDTFKPLFRGQLVDRVDFAYPDRFMAENLAILSALIVAPNLGGDIGSIIAPAGTALVFKSFIQLTFASVGESGYNETRSYADIFTDLGFNADHPPPAPPNHADATALVYTRYLLPRYLRALFVASFFYIVLRYIRHLGPK